LKSIKVGFDELQGQCDFSKPKNACKSKSICEDIFAMTYPGLQLAVKLLPRIILNIVDKGGKKCHIRTDQDAVLLHTVRA
jgi:hypothetical protein